MNLFEFGFFLCKTNFALFDFYLAAGGEKVIFNVEMLKKKKKDTTLKG